MIAEWCIIIAFALFFLKNIWLRLFLIYSVICVVTKGVTSGIFSKESEFVMISIFYYLLWYQLIKNNLNRKRVEYLINAICIIALIQAFFMILHTFDIHYFFKPKASYHGISVVGFLDNRNLSGAFTAGAMFVFFRKRWCIGLIPMTYALVKAASLGAVLSFGVGVVIYGMYVLKTKRIKFEFLLVIFLAVVLYWGKYDNHHKIMNIKQEVRFKVWSKLVIKAIPQKPLMGWGMGWHKFLIKIMAEKGELQSFYKNQTKAHNEPIQLTVEQGLIGLILALGFIGSIIYIFRKPQYLTVLLFCSIVCLLINSLTIFVFHVTIALLVMTYFAMYEYLAQEVQNGERI